MAKEFFLSLNYKNKTKKFKIINPDAPLSEIMKNVMNAKEDGGNVFDMPELGASGDRIGYFFARTDGRKEILQFELKKQIMHLSDYKIKSGDTLVIVTQLIAG